MKFITKSLLLSLLVVGTQNMYGMQDDAPLEGTSVYTASSSADASHAPTTTPRRLDLKRVTTNNLHEAYDLLLHLASIYYLDSVSSNEIKTLAWGRILSNAYILKQKCHGLFLGNINGAISKAELVNGISIYARGKNSLKDLKNQSNASKLALRNIARNNRKDLNTKKLVQAAWLLANKCVLPFLAQQVGHLANPLVLEMSELARQKQLYGIIKNKRKVA